MSLVIASIGLILVVGIAVDALVFNPLDRAVRERRGLLADAAGPTFLQRAIRITVTRLQGRRHPVADGRPVARAD
jgi:hypothetical protein